MTVVKTTLRITRSRCRRWRKAFLSTASFTAPSICCVNASIMLLTSFFWSSDKPRLPTTKAASLENASCKTLYPAAAFSSTSPDNDAYAFYTSFQEVNAFPRSISRSKKRMSFFLRVYGIFKYLTKNLSSEILAAQ